MSVQISQTVAAALKGLEVARENEVALENTKEMNRKESDAHLKKLRELLRSGETTGDPLRDMVIQAHGFSEEVEALYRPVQEQLKGKKGEFVLLSFVADIPYRYHGTGVDSAPKDCYRLGVLQEEKLVLGADEMHHASISLDIPRYVFGQKDFLSRAEDLRRRLEIAEGDIFGYGFSVHLSTPSLGSFLKEGKSELVIGDEAVKAWLEKNHMPGLFKPAAEALSRLILEHTDP